MPTFRAVVKKIIPSRAKRYAKFLEGFFTPTPSREKAASAFNAFFNPGIGRDGLFGALNEFLNPRIQRTGFIGAVNQLLSPTRSRSGFIGFLNNILVSPVFRLEQGGDIIRPRQRDATALQRFISGLNEFLNAYTHFSDLIGIDIAVLTPSQAYQQALESLTSRSGDRLRNIARALVEGDITPAQFRQSFMQEIRRLHMQAAILGIRGLGNMTFDIDAIVSGRIQREFDFLNGFITAIFDPDQNISGSQIIARAGSYASAGRVTSVLAQAALIENLYGGGQLIEGQLFVRRVTKGDNSVCPDCDAWAEIGYVSVSSGVLPMPGQQCRCNGNCRCTVQWCLAGSLADCPED